MTPRILNKRIRQGEFFYVPDPNLPGTYSELIVREAKTVTKGKQRLVKVRTDAGWIFAASVRLSGRQDTFVLEGEGPLTWCIN